MREAGAEALAGARAVLAHRDLRRFFGAYFGYEDGVNTVVAFSSIFAAQTLGFPMERLIVLYLVVQVSALLGALLWAWPIDRLGPRRVVAITLAQWAAVVIGAYFVKTQTQFFVLAVFAGSGLGAVQAASRTLVMGPIVFGSISHAAGGNQRLGIVAIGAFFVVGFRLLARLRGGGPTHLLSRAGAT